MATATINAATKKELERLEAELTKKIDALVKDNLEKDVVIEKQNKTINKLLDKIAAMEMAGYRKPLPEVDLTVYFNHRKAFSPDELKVLWAKSVEYEGAKLVKVELHNDDYDALSIEMGRTPNSIRTMVGKIHKVYREQNLYRQIFNEVQKEKKGK